MRSVFDMVAEESSAILLVASAVMLDTCNILPVAQIQQSGHGGMWFFQVKTGHHSNMRHLENERPASREWLSAIL